ncbi:MAG: lysophospholipid acyltransferase family protein [Candidatus Omnitrophica bacterium]|nr:lysophospholipid acyltransferase family protein [Candidatus Omnitrophota bacterium]
MIQYYLYKFGKFFVERLPLSLSYKLAGFISDIRYYIATRDRRNVKNNLKVILPGSQDIPRLSKEVFRNFAKYLVDFFYLAKRMNPEYIREHVTIKNLNYLPDVLKNGKGGIILTAHVGNWELGGFTISRLGYPLIAVALPHKERSVNNLFNSQRESHGMTIVPNNVAIRECIKGLRDNRLIALLGDRDFNAAGEVLEFFGKQTRFPKGPAAFSLKTGAAIIPAFFTRDNGDHFTLTFEKPIFPPENVDDSSSINMMREYIKIVEETIQQHPTQWYMFQRFWL